MMIWLFLIITLIVGPIFSTTRSIAKCERKGRTLFCPQSGDTYTHLQGSTYKGINLIRLQGSKDRIKILLDLFPNLKHIRGDGAKCSGLRGGTNGVEVNGKRCHQIRSTSLSTTPTPTMTTSTTTVTTPAISTSTAFAQSTATSIATATLTAIITSITTAPISIATPTTTAKSTATFTTTATSTATTTTTAISTATPTTTTSIATATPKLIATASIATNDAFTLIATAATATKTIIKATSLLPTISTNYYISAFSHTVTTNPPADDYGTIDNNIMSGVITDLSQMFGGILGLLVLMVVMITLGIFRNAIIQRCRHRHIVPPQKDQCIQTVPSPSESMKMMTASNPYFEHASVAPDVTGDDREETTIMCVESPASRDAQEIQDVLSSGEGASRRQWAKIELRRSERVKERREKKLSL